MKIILSRKGFDSQNGGYPSPILEDGTLLSLPIPHTKGQKGPRYPSLKYQGKRLSTWMRNCKIKIPKGTAHLDPDIRRDALENRESSWRGAFGQAHHSARHLINQLGIDEETGDFNGDILFLFFGLFGERGEKPGRHIIWGYLFVDQVIRIESEAEFRQQYPHLSWAFDHPHVVNADYFSRHLNLLFLAKERYKNLPGFGTLSYHPDLQLTKSGQRKVCLWEMPDFFHPGEGLEMSYHQPERFTRHGDKVHIYRTGPGQEYVIQDNERVEKWALDIISAGLSESS